MANAALRVLIVEDCHDTADSLAEVLRLTVHDPGDRVDRGLLPAGVDRRRDAEPARADLLIGVALALQLADRLPFVALP